MLVRTVAAAVSVGVAAAQTSPTPMPCAFVYRNLRPNTVGASWDLSGLFSSQADYNWIDSDDALTINATYTFNICGNVNNNPSPLCMRGAAPAYQYTKDANPTCYRLGTDLTTSPNSMSWSLIDPNNPTEGVALTYSGGDNDFCAYNRALTINFHCSMNASQTFPIPGPTPPDKNSFFTWIDEVNMCQYVANSYSPAGCPLECPVTNGQVCAGNGVCGWDTGLLVARCFCNDDWIESDCTTPRTPFPTGAVAGSVFGGIFVGALSVIATIGALQRRGGSGSGGTTTGAAVEGFYA